MNATNINCITTIYLSLNASLKVFPAVKVQQRSNVSEVKYVTPTPNIIYETSQCFCCVSQKDSSIHLAPQFCSPPFATKPFGHFIGRISAKGAVVLVFGADLFIFRRQ